MTAEPSATAAALDDEAVLLVGHGSRREASNEQVQTLAAALEERLGLPVDVGFIELAEPSINDAVDGLAPVVSAVSVVHLSLFAAGHVKNDVPVALDAARAEHPELTIHNGAHLGIHPSIVALLDDRVRRVEDDLGVDRAADDVVVVLCARGSSDPDSNADVCKLARMLWEGRAFETVAPSFIGVTEPLLGETLAGLRDGGHDAVVVLPYMLGDGVLTRRIHEQTAEFAAEYDGLVGSAAALGTDDCIVDVLADRWREAREGEVSMSCDTCKYRVTLDGFEEEVDGTRDDLVHVLEHLLEDHKGEHGHGHEHDHDRDEAGEHEHGHDDHQEREHGEHREHGHPAGADHG